MTYEKLLSEAYYNSIEVYEKEMKPTVKGLYSDKIIWVNKYISSSIEKRCILAEELGHYHTSYGVILDQTKLQNRKQEKRARNWAYECLIPLNKIVQAHKHCVKNRHELADYLDVTEAFLEEALKRYKEKYGLFKSIDGFTICFEPLGVIEMFED
jgi:Zn-dependent peptidase ImmA (M78 family)